MKKLSILIALAILTALPCGAAEKTLTILHTNDVHDTILPRNYSGHGVELVNAGGMAMRAAMIRDIRSSAKGPVLYLDAGDTFTRGKYSSFHGKPEFECMNIIGVDAMALGNNELKATEGVESQSILADLIRHANFPVLAANLTDPSGKLKHKPYTIIEKGGIRIGILGVTSDRSKTYPQCAGLVFSEPIETARKTVAEMKGKYDFLIALTHIGYASDCQLAIAIPEIDVIVGGHSHTWLDVPTKFVSSKRKYAPWEIGGTLCVQDGEFGVKLGRLDLNLRSDTTGRYRITSYSGKLVPVMNIRPAEDTEKILEKYVK